MPAAAPYELPHGVPVEEPFVQESALHRTASVLGDPGAYSLILGRSTRQRRGDDMREKRWAIPSQPSETRYREGGTLAREIWALPLEEAFLDAFLCDLVHSRHVSG